MDVLKVLKENLNCSEILTNESMAEHTSFRTGGKADIFIKAGSAEDIIKAVKM